MGDLADKVALIIVPTAQAAAKDEELASAFAAPITKSLGTLPANEQITVRFSVTINAAPSNFYSVSNTAQITADGNISINSTTATNAVVQPPSIAKAFGAALIALNGTTSLTYTITNGSSSPLTGLSFSDALPAGLVINTPNGANNTCGGTLTATDNTGSIGLTGGTVGAAATCTVKVDVKGTSEGTKTSSTSVITSIEGGNGNSAAATLTVTNTINWIGATNADWNTTSNWSPAAIPVSGNNVVIGSNGVVNEPVISAVNVTVNNLTINTGRTLTVNGGRTLTVTNALINDGTLNVAGAFSAGTFTSNGTVAFTGTAAQNIPAGAYANLTINNPSGVNLIGNVTISGLLNLASGALSTGTNTLIVGSGGSATRTSGYIVGNMRKTYAAAGGFTFDVGTANGYSPATINVTAGTFPLNFNVKAVQGAQPNMANTATALQRYWTISPSGGSPTANLSFNYLQTDVAGNETSYRIYRVSGGTPFEFGNNCPSAPCVDTVNNIAFINNVNQE